MAEYPMRAIAVTVLAAPTTNGGIEPATPREVQTIHLVVGIIRINKIRKGRDRRTFTNSDRAPYVHACKRAVPPRCERWLGPVRHRATPAGSPISAENASARTVMVSVSSVPTPISGQYSNVRT